MNDHFSNPNFEEMTGDTLHEYWMRQAIAEAQEAEAYQGHGNTAELLDRAALRCIVYLYVNEQIVFIFKLFQAQFSLICSGGISH